MLNHRPSHMSRNGQMHSPPGRRRGRVYYLLGLLAVAGCGAEAKVEHPSVSEPVSVRLMKPPVRDIVRKVGQPSFIESYERTSIYPKMTAYIEKWVVDIGDKVKKNDVLATLFVPEMVEDYGTKKADAVYEQERVELAKKAVEVANADVKAAQASVAEAVADLAKFQAQVDRWDVEVKRLKKEVDRGVVDPEILLESSNQLRASTAARDAARATIAKTEADLLSRQAAAAKANVDVTASQARLSVAESEVRRLKAWVGYLTLTAPFDGIIVARNANTGDFVLPATGDPTANSRAPDVSGTGAAPIYVVDRTDIVRIFVDVPEDDANYVHIGSKASVIARAFRDQALPAKVTRTAWALNVKSRTLRAEIDLPNPESRLLPGMYAYANVVIERPGVRALPEAALIHDSDRTFCLVYKDGKAERIEVETGITDGEWVEVTNRRDDSAAVDDAGGWVPIDGSEQVILGDLSIINDGSPVKVETEPAKK